MKKLLVGLILFASMSSFASATVIEPLEHSNYEYTLEALQSESVQKQISDILNENKMLKFKTIEHLSKQERIDNYNEFAEYYYLFKVFFKFNGSIECSAPITGEGNYNQVTEYTVRTSKMTCD